MFECVSRGLGIKGFITDIDEIKAIRCSTRTQDFDFARAEWAFTVKVERQSHFMFSYIDECPVAA